MAIIKPFKAYRPRREIVSEVAALPYDVYNREEAKKAVEGKPLSFLRIDRAETAFDDSVDTYAPCVYEKAKELLDGMIERGDYVEDAAPMYYLYELVMDGRSQTGIVACASIEDYESGVIMKHENTREDKEIDRITHVDTVSYTHLRAHETDSYLVCRLLLEKKKKNDVFCLKKQKNVIEGAVKWTCKHKAM